MYSFKPSINNTLNITSFPEDSIIYSMLDRFGYEGYIAKTFLSDLLLFSKLYLVQVECKTISEYTKLMSKLISDNTINYWLEDSIKLYIVLSNRYDLRVLESISISNAPFDLDSIKHSYNYVFDIHNINLDVQLFLDITEDHLNEIEKLPDNIIKILQLSSGHGNFINTAISTTTSVDKMKKYGDIVKVAKHKFVDPLFDLRFATKTYNIRATQEVTHKSNKLIIGYFLNAFAASMPGNILLRTLGAILLNSVQDNSDVNVYIYELYGASSYNMINLKSIEQIIEFFKQDKQLELFPADNSVINKMIKQHPNSDIIFIPNIHNYCDIKVGFSANKINIISSTLSKFNKNFENICKSSGGTFLVL